MKTYWMKRMAFAIAAMEPTNLFLVRVNRFSADVRFAMIGIEQRGDHAHGGCFTGSVGSDKSKHVAFRELQSDIICCNQIAVSLGQISRFNHRESLSSKKGL